MKIKKAFTALCILIFASTLISCKLFEDKVILSLGNYDKREFYTSGGFRDYTDYAKYYYMSANVDNNRYLKKVQESDIYKIYEYVNDFEGWVDADCDAADELDLNYDFNQNIIDTEDYFYIYVNRNELDDGTTYVGSYNIYLWDSQTRVLYYFHNNI